MFQCYVTCVTCVTLRITHVGQPPLLHGKRENGRALHVRLATPAATARLYPNVPFPNGGCCPEVAMGCRNCPGSTFSMGACAPLHEISAYNASIRASRQAGGNGAGRFVALVGSESNAISVASGEERKVERSPEGEGSIAHRRAEI